MARIGQMLISEKFITPKELDTALEIHVLHGVKLGTCLVEMGYVTDDDLAMCLGKKSGKTFLSKDQLLAYGAGNLSVISPATIKKHRIIPVGTSGGPLSIATDSELSPKKQVELETFLGRKIELIAVSGYAVDCFLEQMFGTQRPGRFLTIYSKTKAPETAYVAEVKKSMQPKPIVINGMEWKSLSDVTQDEESARVIDDIFNATQNRGDIPHSLVDAAEHLSHATTRDDVAQTVLDFLSNSSENAALFIVIDGVARGWKAYSNRKKLPGFEAFSAPIETIPDLQQCVIMKKPVRGKMLTEEMKLLLRKFLNYEGLPVYFPIFIQKRVVAILLCEGSEQLNPIETAELCRKASYALEILILRSKLLS